MNLTERAIKAGPTTVVATTWSGSRRLYRLPIYCVCSAFALVITYLLGKDLPWDALDYHLYAGFSALHDRFAQDYFAAGPQAYFNPYAYVPFYLLVHIGLSSLQIAVVAALVQSAILWLTYELALSCCTTEVPRRRVALGICAAMWALANPILLGQLGTSFADITTAELVLAGWLLLVRAIRTPKLGPVLWAGLVIGVATALKLTNAVHALSAFVLLLFVPGGWRTRLRLGFGYGAALGAGFAAAAASWCYRLEQQFGNPFFPLLNGWFRSSEFVTGRLVNYRFVPDSFFAALMRPFAIANPVFMVQEEMRVPDVRYALLLLLLIALVTYWVFRRWRRASDVTNRSALEPAKIATADTRVLVALGCALVVDWIGWVTASGNGRYFLSMACVTAVVSVVLLFRMLAQRPKVLGYLVVAIFGVQGVQLALGTEYRWNGSPWDDHWVDVDVPPALARQTNLYFTMAFQSDAFLAAYLPLGSGYVDLAGQYPPSPTGASGARIAALVRRFSPHLRMLVGGTQLYEDDQHKSPRRSSIDALLAPYGLRVDSSDCQTIVLNNLHRDPELNYTASQAKDMEPRAQGPHHGGVPILSCHVVTTGPMSLVQQRQKLDADLVLDRLEAACPQLFQPRGVHSQFFGRGWMRYYLNTDEIAWVSRGWVKFDDPVSGDGLTFLGQEVDWLRAPLPIVCGRRDGHYYARLATQKYSAHGAMRPRRNGATVSEDDADADADADADGAAVITRSP
jgi:hypothetical protein